MSDEPAARPMNWKMKVATVGWRRAMLTAPEWASEWIVYYSSSWEWVKVIELIGKLSLVFAAILWVSEYGERAQERADAIKAKHYRAWDLINSARGAPGDGGRTDALQDLNEDRVSLAGLPLQNAILKGVQLSSALLGTADFSAAVLTEANFCRANIDGADFTRSRLYSVDFRYVRAITANFEGAEASDSSFDGADLASATFDKSAFYATSFNGAALRTAKIHQTTFERSDLSFADLRASDLEGTTFERSNLTNTDFTKSNLAPNQLEGAHRCHTKMADGAVDDTNCKDTWYAEGFPSVRDRFRSVPVCRSLYDR